MNKFLKITAAGLLLTAAACGQKHPPGPPPRPEAFRPVVKCTNCGAPDQASPRCTFCKKILVAPMSPLPSPFRNPERR